MDSNKFVVFDLQNGRVSGSLAKHIVHIVVSVVVVGAIAGLISSIESQSWFSLGFWAMLSLLSIGLLLLLILGLFPTYGDIIVLSNGRLYYRVGYLAKPSCFCKENIKSVVVSKKSVTLKTTAGSVVFLSFDNMEAWVCQDIFDCIVETSAEESIPCEVG